MTQPTDRAEDSRRDDTEEDDQENVVDEAADESFPASDPPAYSGGTATPRGTGREPGHLDREPGNDDDA